MTNAESNKKFPAGIILFGITLILVTIGLLMVFESTYAKAFVTSKPNSDAFSYLKKQTVGMALGLAGLFILSHINYRKLRSFAEPMLFVSILMLCLVWLPYFRPVGAAARWIGVGAFKFQPSELAKISLILYLAARLSRKDRNPRELMKGLLPPLSISLFVLLLIEREPDLGTAVVLFLTMITQLFLAGVRKRHLCMVIGFCALAGVLVTSAFTHRTQRFETWKDPSKNVRGAAYQMDQSLKAVGSGKWFGVGIGQGKQKFSMPEGESDFIFATLAEELGFARVVPVVTLLFLVGAIGFWIALNSKDQFGTLLAGGIAALISWQSFINIAVVTNTIPATGVPLPFISFGSTSLSLLLSSVGILINISHQPNENPKGNRVKAGKQETSTLGAS